MTPSQNHLNLLFPQWQGSGPVNELFYATLQAARLCTKKTFTQVPVTETEELDVSNGVLGYESILSQMQSAAELVTQAAPETILTIGGDCGIEPVPVSYLNKQHNGDLTLVWLDAHADMNTPATSPSGHFHGMPLATLMGFGDQNICQTCLSTLAPEQVVLAGIRTLDPEERQLIQSKNISRVSAREINTNVSALIKAIKEKGNTAVYIHIDLDVLDPKTYPFIGHPEPEGLKQNTLERMVDEIDSEFTIAGLGLMEFTRYPFGEKDQDLRGLDVVRALADRVF